MQQIINGIVDEQVKCWEAVFESIGLEFDTSLFRQETRGTMEDVARTAIFLAGAVPINDTARLERILDDIKKIRRR